MIFYRFEKNLLKYTNIEIHYWNKYLFLKSNFGLFFINKSLAKYRNEDLLTQVYVNEKKILFICEMKIIKNVIFTLKNLLYGLFLLYNVRLKLVGLTARGLLKGKRKKIIYGKKKKVIKNFTSIRLDLGFNHFVDIILSTNIYIRKRKKKFTFFTTSKKILHNFMLFLKLVKKMTAYKLKGVRFSGLKLKFKKGKKNFRVFR